MRMHSSQLVVSGLLLAVSSSQAYAVNASYSLESGLYSSDNVRRTATNEVSETALLLGAQLSVVDQSSVNDFNIGLDFRHLEYSKNNTADQNQLSATLISKWSIVQDGLSWIADGFYGQQAVNPLNPDTPDNLQNIGYFATGPQALFRITNTDSFILDYRYVDFYSQDTNNDYISNYARMALSRKISPTLTATLNTEYADFNYDDDVANTNFSQSTYSILLERIYSTSRFTLNLGRSTVNPDTGDEVQSTTKGLTYSRQMNRYNSLDIQYLETIGIGAPTFALGNPGAPVQNSLSVSKLSALSYNYNRAQLQVGFDLGYTNQDFLGSTINNDRVIRSAAIGLNYGSPTRIVYSLDYSRALTDFYTVEQETIDDIIALGVTKKITKRVDGILTVGNYRRKTTDNLAVTQSTATENTVVLTFRYTDRL